MAKDYIEGKRQEVRFGAPEERVYFSPQLYGRTAKPDARPVYRIISPDGRDLATGMMEEVPAREDGLLSFADQTAEFSAGAVLTGATSGATAVIRSIYSVGTDGWLALVRIDGTYLDGEDITDDGPRAGAAVAVDGVWSGLYMARLTDLSLPPGEDYRLTVDWTHDGIEYEDHVLFDTVYDPYDPSVRSGTIDDLHPEWLPMRDKTWVDWWPAIKAGHRELCNRLRAAGRRPFLVVDPTQLYLVELAFVEREIARLCRFSREEREYWERRANEAWGNKPPLTYRDSVNAKDVSESSDVVTSGRMWR